MTSKIKSYYQLTKPGIIRGNVITAAAGFLFAASGNVDWWLLAQTLVGIALLIASACVLNNYIDRDIDAQMDRTKTRALAAKDISGKGAMIYAGVLGVSAFLVLGFFTNNLTLLLGLIALINYVVIYGYAKRKSTHGTLVGTISGALPITAGYTAVTGQLDAAAGLLFLILVFWQMPHFYAIAIRRMSEYRAAKIPVLPLVKGIRHTKFQMMVYTVAFVVATVMLSASGYTGKTYLFVMGLVGGAWLIEVIRGFYVGEDRRWARMVFFESLIVLLVFSILISVDNLIV